MNHKKTTVVELSKAVDFMNLVKYLRDLYCEYLGSLYQDYTLIWDQRTWNYYNRPSKTDPLKLIYFIFLYFRKYQGFNKINVLLSPTQSADSNYDVGWFSNCHVSELLNIWQDDLDDYVFLFDHETEWHRSEDDQIVIQNQSRKLSLGKLILNSFWSLLSLD